MRRYRIGIGIGIGALAVIALLWWVRGTDGGGGEAARAGKAAEMAAAQARSGQRIDVATVARGSIEGTVRDPAGAPVGGARVCGFADSEELPPDATRDPFCAISERDGRYRLAELLPARYRVHAHAAGFTPGTYRTPGMTRRQERGIRLPAGETRAGIDIALGAGGVEVLGVVKDIGGGPVGGATVYVRAGARFGRRGATATTESDADGQFRVWVAAGPIHVQAEADGYAGGEMEAVAPGQLVEVLLTPESVLAGRVIETEGAAPVPGALVTVGGDPWSGDDTSWATALTDADGRFRLSRLAPARYKPTASAPGRYGEAAESVLLGLGQTVEDVVIEVHRAAVVTGRIVLADGETPCPRGRASLADPRAPPPLTDGTDDDGRVRFDAVLPGSYTINVRCDGHLADAEYPALVVAPGVDPPEQIWKVGAGGRLRGLVRRAGGEAVAGASVSAQPAVQATFLDWQWAETEDDGSFEMSGLRGGAYQVSVDAEGEASPKDPVAVEVPEGGEATVELVLPASGRVIGAVVDEAGQPVARVHVRAAGRRMRWRTGGGGTQTLDDGSFVLEGLSPGSYRITAARDGWWGGELRAPGKSDDDAAGETVDVIAGKTARVRLVVESLGGAIGGTVVDASGAAVTDAFVDAERESDSAAAAAGRAGQRMRWSWRRTPALTGTDGGFTIDKLARGRYTVRAYRKGGGEAVVEGVAPGATITITIRTPGSIAGTVVRDGGGAPERMTVTARDARTGFERAERFYRTGGAFLLRDLPEGSFEVAVSSPDGTGAETVELAAGQARAGVRIALAARAQVSGRLVAGDDGRPMPGYMLQVSPLVAGQGFRVGWTGDRPPQSGPDGRFEVPDAPAGKVQLFAFSLDPGSGYGFVRKTFTLAGGQTLDLGDLRVPKLRARFDEQPGDLGFTLKQAPPGTDPAEVPLTVAVVRPGGPAAQAGLQVGDVIVSVDDQDVRNDPFLYGSLVHVPPGETVQLGLARGATVTITAGPPR
jgi:hypothetical protein